MKQRNTRMPLWGSAGLLALVATRVAAGLWVTYGVGAGYLIPLREPWNLLGMLAALIGTALVLRSELRTPQRPD